MTETIPISRRALLQRVKRALANNGLKLVARRENQRISRRFLVVEGDRLKCIVDDLVQLARAQGLMKSWESLEEEPSP